MSSVPEFEKKSFACPYCQVFTTQTWERLTTPKNVAGNRVAYPSQLHQSICFSCHRPTFWLGERMIFPPVINVTMPSPDLPAELHDDFMEARNVFNASPRAAAALLRLLIQKLLVTLGEDGKNINHDIGQLVKKGKITERTRKMLDSVRIFGNESVHPGEINLNDDQALAISLFDFVNLIVWDTITHDNYVNTVYSRVPEDKRKGVEDRDRNSQRAADLENAQ